MPITTTAGTVQQLLADLMRCVKTLHSVQGDSPAMRRVLNDADAIRGAVERLQIDIDELTAAALAPCTKAVTMTQISDAEYDMEFWRDVDHEGLGSQSLACPPKH